MALKSKQSLLIAAAVVTVAGVGLIGAHAVSAETKPDQSIVSKIATKFNLSQDEVQAVFDEDRQAHEVEMRESISERLQAKVDDGAITAEQKTLIEEKLTALQEAREADKDSFDDMTEDERHEAMKQKRDELEQWAEDNGIPTDLLYFKGRGGHGRGPSGPGEFRD